MAVMIKLRRRAQKVGYDVFIEIFVSCIMEVINRFLLSTWQNRTDVYFKFRFEIVHINLNNRQSQLYTLMKYQSPRISRIQSIKLSKPVGVLSSPANTAVDKSIRTHARTCGPGKSKVQLAHVAPRMDSDVTSWRVRPFSLVPPCSRSLSLSPVTPTPLTLPP